MRKLVYYVGTTIDGFIAAPDGSFDFFPVTPDVLDFLVHDYPDALPTHVRAQLGVDVPNPNFDVGVQGRTTFQAALDIGVTSPHAHLQQILVSSTMTERSSWRSTRWWSGAGSRCSPRGSAPPASR